METLHKINITIGLRILIVIFFLIIIFHSQGTAQENFQDVVYLKNGSVIRGIIIEQVPNESIKLQTKDGNLFVYRMDEIEKLTKEQPINFMPLGNSAYSFNPLGFLQFGPILTGELKLSSNTFLTPHLRIASLGLIYHALVEYDQISMSSMAIGLGVKRYIGNTNTSNRFYSGGLIEYGWGSGKNDVGESYESELNHSYLAVMSNFGYRWRNSSKTFINLGLLTGVAKTISDKEVTTFGEIEFELTTYFIGMLEFSVGFEK